MRVVFVSSLIVFLGLSLTSSKLLGESSNRAKLRRLNKSDMAKMIEDSKLLEKLAKETYIGKVPTSEETYKTKDPTDEETHLSKDPTSEETYLSKDPTDEETYLTRDPTAEQTRDATGISGKEEEELLAEEDDEEEDEATVDKPTDAVPLNFLKYPEYVEDFKPYPRFAILRNGYVHHMNLEF